jgi:hypothetical protein
MADAKKKSRHVVVVFMVDAEYTDDALGADLAVVIREQGCDALNSLSNNVCSSQVVGEYLVPDEE